MAWGSLQYEHAFQWSATALLNAFVEVLVAFLVLLCAILNCSTASFIRVSGRFRIPCSCCAHLRKETSISAIEASQKPLVLSKPKSIVVPVESKVRLNGIDHSDDYLTVGGLKSVDLSSVYALTEKIPCELPLDHLAGREEAASEYASFPRSGHGNDDFNDGSQEDVDRAKVQELLCALQTERENMAALYSELEEERNSSATAASEALAMISRLQEEKAAVQMEYRQFQRMVMEKAMYDQEAIEVLKEILAKREEERIEWEEEVRLYKERLDGVLMEERDYAARVGSNYVPMLLEGTPKHGNLTSPKFELAEGSATERNSSSGKITKDERIIPNGRLSKDEDAGLLDRLSKTSSQLLNALRLEGIPEPASALVESPSSGNESLKVIAKFPVRAESPPVLDHEHYKAALGLGVIKTSREIGPSIPPAVPKKQTAKALKDAGKASDDSGLVSRERTPPVISKEIEKAQVAKDAGKTADEPALATREIGLLVPPAAAKKQSDQPGIVNSEVNLPILPPAVAKKQNEKTLVKDDAKAAEEPEFVSLKRRWSSRGSQEVSVSYEDLAKAKEDRRIEEKRLSVLEYVRNLEEQLQQQARRPVAQLARARSVDGREEDARFKTPAQLESCSVSVASGSSGGHERDESVHRRLFADGDSVDEEANTNSVLGEEDDKINAKQYSFKVESDSKISNDEGGFYANAGKSEVSADEALFVHDVYEVQNHPHEASSRLGVWVAGTMSGLELMSPVSDRLGKPDNLNVEEDDSRINEERETLFLSNATALQQQDEDFGFESQWKHLQRRAQCNDLPICTLLREENSRSLMEDEVEQLTQRLKALEADRYLMQQTIDSLRRENGEMKLLQEIAEQWHELRGIEQKELQFTDFLPQILNFQVSDLAPRFIHSVRYLHFILLLVRH